MTLVSQIITDAFRMSNLIAISASPTSAEQTEALRYLNRLVLSVFGHEMGEQLQAFPIGRAGIDRPSGYPWYNPTPSNEWFVPKNKRLMLNLADDLTVYLHPKPDDGSRFAISDVSGNLATNNLIVDGNGRMIEDAATITLNTNGLDRQWFYRDDLANWVRLSTLVAGDTFPFPEEFDDYFIGLLAMRLNPSYAATMDEQSSMMMTRSARQFKARYAQTIEKGSEMALVLLSKSAADRDAYARDWYYGDPNARFDVGNPYD